MAGILGMVVTLLALRSRQYRELSDRYAGAPAATPEPELPAAVA